jgi:hypothetical protein
MICNVSPLPLEFVAERVGRIDVLPLWTAACAQIKLMAGSQAAAHGCKT